MKVPERYRIKTGQFRSDSSYGNNGAFEIALSNRSTAYVIAGEGDGWEHVSVHVISDKAKRIPTWPEMCKIKDMFWDDEETVVQYHPPKSQYVNDHNFTLHLWKQIGVDFPLPPIEMV